MPVETEMHAGRATKVVVATSVMLTFISFWRAAAIVLCDLGSSAFYVGGIAEQAVGKAAPWFILGVMCFSYAVRALYVESCAMFTRGGVYRVVKEAMGGTLAPQRRGLNGPPTIPKGIRGIGQARHHRGDQKIGNEGALSETLSDATSVDRSGRQKPSCPTKTRG